MSVWFYLCLTDWKSLLNLVTSNIWNVIYVYYWGHHHVVEHLHDIMALQINKSHLSYIWQSGGGYIIDHLNLELL